MQARSQYSHGPKHLWFALCALLSGANATESAGSCFDITNKPASVLADICADGYGLEFTLDQKGGCNDAPERIKRIIDGFSVFSRLNLTHEQVLTPFEINSGNKIPFLFFGPYTIFTGIPYLLNFLIYSKIYRLKSINKLTKTNPVATVKTSPCKRFISFLTTESTNNFPIPFKLKTDSVTTKPPNKNANSNPITVTVGNNAFLIPCFTITILSNTPFALAVLI